VVSGNYAYVADGVSGLTVVDISEIPAAGSIIEYKPVGSYTTNAEYSYGLLLEGTVLYLATAESGLIKLDVATPETPAYQDVLAPVISCDDVAVAGDYTYMLDRKKGLRIFETKTYPIIKSYLSLPGESSDIAVSGNYAYVAKKGGNVAVLDVTDKSSPVPTGVEITAADPRKLFIADSRLFIANGSGSTLRIEDITNPLSPVFLGSVATAGDPVSVQVSGNRAYVAEEGTGLEIFNVAVPSAPVLLASAPLTDARDVCVKVSGNLVYAFVADGINGLRIYDASNPSGILAEPVTVDKMDTKTKTPKAFTAVSVAVLDEFAYVGMGPDGILVLKIDDPLIPVEKYHAPSSGSVSDIVAETIKDTPFLTTAEKFAGFRIQYLAWITPGTNGDFYPTIDSGCFVGTASEKSIDPGWMESVRDIYRHFISVLKV
jgi:hypothetical protein